MDTYAEVAFAGIKPHIFLAEFIFRLCGLNFLKGEASKHIVYVWVVVGYFYQLKTDEKLFRDDVVLAGYLSFCACNTFSLVLKGYVGYVTRLLNRMYHKIRAHGKLRCFIHVVSLVLVAAFCTCSAVQAFRFVSTKFTERMLWRLEDNVIEIEEDRTMFKEVLIHPATKGEKEPYLLSKFYRYPMEDVQMSCEFTKLWLSSARPAKHQVAWRKNGVPVKMTDRHRHQLSLREVEKKDTIVDALLKSHGASNYEIKATLTISLLLESDFGSYTCHCAENMNISVNDFETNSAKLTNANEESQRNKQKTKQQNTERQYEYVKQLNAVEKKMLFKDLFLHVGEFRLIKMPRRQEIIRAPASAILHLTTSYWHLSTKDDIEVDYTVNNRPYHDLCHDSYFHGCSKALLFYWMFSHVEGERFGMPPLQLFTIWKSPTYPAEQYSLVHCLCENAYGYHNMKYLRRYYNSTKQQFELFEIPHPHVLVVIPREQNMLNLFKNRSQCSPVIEQPVCEKPPSTCKTSFDFETIKDFAEVVVTYFNYFEVVVLFVASAVILYLVRKALLFFEYVGWHIRRLSLDGSMGYLSTVEKMGSCAQPQHSAKNIPRIRKKKQKHYDVFLSHSDAPTDLESIQNILPLLERCGLSVCLRDRDLEANKPELQELSKAMKNSKTFLIFLSAAYCEDHFRKDFEAAMIVETLSDRKCGTSSVLLVKMDQCEIPSWLCHLTLHDWTTANLTKEDHHLRLLKWLEPPEHRQTLRSKLDVFMTILPQLIVGLLIVIPILGYHLVHKMVMQ